eukprot:CAMPEP_0171223186 /NCGR_PEP_ID=MMETSP0790-20130122/35648_1 /TAXON_ID=2925 /ORGANISM="Alexandrium catenella, Strain OF101" /LENGTH=263 /DNA_ID=CAMNT_0011689153 /DNA_START=80 /DNA_END=871 /DNA_ORIENTATION=+
MQELQTELKAAKDKWAKEVELSKAEKGAPGYPFPVAITRYVPTPEAAAAWDCEELPVRLVIKSAEIGPEVVSVEVPPIFPGELSPEIEKAVAKEWKKQIGSKKKAKGEVWMVNKILEWVEAHFVDLLRIVPSYVDSYIGCDDMGASMRRYTLVGPAAEEEEEEEEEEDEEEQERRLKEYLEREQARIEAEFDEKYKTDEGRRKMAEAGMAEDGEKARQLSKAEKAELNKSRKEKSGHRWRKTGSKANKPTKDEEDKSKKDKKK